ncbi:hypothetical protein AB833_24660 [Chromatiales bacterium (ex Bugula neritina AB1)]|nr:hypothetical protein AB833_24660 [Chromatiales bacterium (ex Bugula neritina AB1)]
MAKPECGKSVHDQFTALQNVGVSAIVSLLEPQEACQLGLQDEPRHCERFDIQFRQFPITDMQLPDDIDAFVQFINRLHGEVVHGSHAVVHCRAGIGRTGMVAASLLIKHGRQPQQALHQLIEARGVEMPDTEEQRAFIFNVAELLGQGGQ